MKPYEMKLIAKLLQLAADEFSNHGCNDFRVDELLTEEEMIELFNATHDKDNQLDAYRYPDRAMKRGDDWVLMQYLAERIESEGK